MLPKEQAATSRLCGEGADQIKKQFPQTLKKFEREIEFIADKFGDKQVSELEALSTALYVKLREHADISRDRHVQLLRESKPHIEPESAMRAIDELKGVIKESKQVVAA